MTWLNSNRDLLDWITTLAAFAGVVLGLRSWWMDRERLKVSPSMVEAYEQVSGLNNEGEEVTFTRTPRRMGVRIVNLGHHPVVVDRAVLVLDNGQTFSCMRGSSRDENYWTLPRELAGRGAILNVYAENDYEIRKAMKESALSPKEARAYLTTGKKPFSGEGTFDDRDAMVEF